MPNILKTLFQRSCLYICLKKKLKEDFYNHIVFQTPTIAEIINNPKSGLNAKEVFKLISASQEFKQMTLKLNSDQDLVREYISKLQTTPVLSSFPLKLIRFGISTALNVNPALGLVTAAFDSFVLDKIGNGWKPNTFVNQVKSLQKKRIKHKFQL